MNMSLLENRFFAERWCGEFKRTFLMYTPINDQKISAVLKDGVLEVRVPKSTSQSGSSIKIE
eukprot:gene11934-13907_t